MLNEIESFFHVSPQLMASLQRWILSKAEDIFDAKNVASGSNSNGNADDVESAALDILEWAPMESTVSSI